MMALLLSACGGGGGGSAAVVQNPPSYYQSAEYNAQYGLGSINAAEIYSDGYSGSGVTVAVIDTGVDLDHPDLADNIATGGYDYLDNDSDANPNGQGTFMSHGTHVAGIIAGVKNDSEMHGVAYNAKILALRAGDSDGSIYHSAIQSSIDRAISQGAKVINASFGGDNVVTNTANKWLSAHNNDIISVHSAGNDYEKSTPYDDNNPLYDARLPAVSGYEALADTLIAVVATDASNVIASYSNRCGDAQNWCMAAPGNTIYSTVDTTDNNSSENYDTKSGTSMAAPHVSGAAAILRSKWPSKTAAQIVDILYDTATDLGVAGTDAIYGRGLLNLDNALYAQGALTVASATGGSHYFSDSGFASSSAMGDALDALPMAAVFDRYHRDYQVDLSASVQKPTAGNLLTELQYQDSSVILPLSANSLLFSEIDKGSIQVRNSYDDIKLSVAYRQNPDQVLSLDAQPSFGDISTTYTPQADSYFSKLNNASVIGFSKDSEIDGSIGLISGYTDAQAQHLANGISSRMVIRPNSQWSLGVGVSYLQEQESFLSNYFSGAYQTGVASTKALNLSATAQLGTGVNLLAQYNVGQTSVEALRDSNVSQISNIDSHSYVLSLMARDIYQARDNVFVSLKQPMRITSGEMSLHVAEGLNPDDSVRFVNHNLSLNPSGSEKTLTLGYSRRPNQDRSINWLLHYKNQPNHQASAEAETQALFKLIQRF